MVPKTEGGGVLATGGVCPRKGPEPVALYNDLQHSKNQWNMQLCAKWLFDAELIVHDVQYQGYVNMHFAIYTPFNIK